MSMPWCALLSTQTATLVAARQPTLTLDSLTSGQRNGERRTFRYGRRKGQRLWLRRCCLAHEGPGPMQARGALCVGSFASVALMGAVGLEHDACPPAPIVRFDDQGRRA